jgi:hypothetical protein
MPRRIVLLPPALPVTCPVCGATFPPGLLAGRQLCPACRAGLTPRRRFALVMAFVVLVISGLIASGIGVPRAWLFIAVLLLSPPVQFIVMFVTVRLFPVELEPTGDFRGILYGDRDAVIRGAPDVPAPSPDIRFDASRKPWTFEDVAMGVFLAAILLGFGYSSMSPLIARVFPWFGATRTGPEGFPVTVHIGHRLIAFTNGSAVSWTCNASLMRGGPAVSAAFLVEPGRTHGVFYSDFLEAHRLPDDDLEEAAREGVTLECREPSGRRHFATLGAPGWQIR